MREFLVGGVGHTTRKLSHAAFLAATFDALDDARLSSVAHAADLLDQQEDRRFRHINVAQAWHDLLQEGSGAKHRGQFRVAFLDDIIVKANAYIVSVSTT